MVRRNYEHHTFRLRLWIFRIAWAIATLIGLLTLIASLQRGDLGPFYGAAMFVFGVCGLLMLAVTAGRVFRPRMTVDGDEVRVYRGEFGTVCCRFCWSDVMNWRQVVVPNEEEHGPVEYRNIYVTLAGKDDPLIVWDVSDEYLIAFGEYAPGKRLVT